MAEDQMPQWQQHLRKATGKKLKNLKVSALTARHYAISLDIAAEKRPVAPKHAKKQWQPV